MTRGHLRWGLFFIILCALESGAALEVKGAAAALEAAEAPLAIDAMEDPSAVEAAEAPLAVEALSDMKTVTPFEAVEAASVVEAVAAVDAMKCEKVDNVTAPALEARRPSEASSHIPRFLRDVKEFREGFFRKLKKYSE
jgi:hypothetical protein